MKPSAKIPASEITAKATYLRRREFLTATGATLAAARERAYAAARLVSFAGARYRNDIGEQAAAVV